MRQIGLQTGILRICARILRIAAVIRGIGGLIEAREFYGALGYDIEEVVLSNGV